MVRFRLLMPLGLGEDVCYNLEPKAGRASWACEMKGDIDGAILWLERQRTFASWLDQNIRSYKDTLLNVDARMAYLKAPPEPTPFCPLTAILRKAYGLWAAWMPLSCSGWAPR